MSDTNSGDDNKTGGSPRATLSLKPRGPGTVRQNFSHGRSNSVVVETKKRRIVKPGEEKKVFAPKTESVTPPAKPAAPAAKPAEKAPAPVEQSSLSAGEMDARARALEEAKLREVEEAKQAAAEAERRAKEDAETRARREAEEAKAAEEAAAAPEETAAEEAPAEGGEADES